jgi:hypothetical protein
VWGQHITEAAADESYFKPLIVTLIASHELMQL